MSENEEWIYNGADVPPTPPAARGADGSNTFTAPTGVRRRPSPLAPAPPAHAAHAAPAHAAPAAPLDHLLGLVGALTTDQIGDESEHVRRLLDLGQLMGDGVHAALATAIQERQMAAIDESELAFERLEAALPEGDAYATLPTLAAERARLAPLHNALVYRWNKANAQPLTTPEQKAHMYDTMMRLISATMALLKIDGAQFDGARQMIADLTHTHHSSTLVARVRQALAEPPAPRPAKRPADATDERPTKRARQ